MQKVNAIKNDLNEGKTKNQYCKLCHGGVHVPLKVIFSCTDALYVEEVYPPIFTHK